TSSKASENTKASLMLAFLIGFHFKNVKKSMKNESLLFCHLFLHHHCCCNDECDDQTKLHELPQ
ncbi:MULTISPECIES: hypothetical protein, partial [Vibrio]